MDRPDIPPAAGLCAGCRHAKPLGTARGSVFLQCLLSRERPEYPQYPRLPVSACAGFQAQSER